MENNLRVGVFDFDGIGIGGLSFQWGCALYMAAMVE
jgi:hypothetical protein